MKKIVTLLSVLPFAILAQKADKFAQLDIEIPTPNEYRSASGAPGYKYYQQKADYKINVEINDETQVLKGEETITYTNNSPDQLDYLWLQLDQNIYAQNSDSKLIDVDKMEDFKSVGDIKKKFFYYDGGFKIEDISNLTGQKLKYFINKTMMRINLEKPLKSKESISFKIKWWYNVNDRMAVGGRSGYEYFEKDKNYLYTIAQWFPRMCVYNDVTGWQNKQFLGKGEFTLPFGDYEVNITVPSDHIVAATGLLQNAAKILTVSQIEKLNQAKKSDKPIMIVNQDEVIEKEKNRETTTKTWTFKATNVRDFAFASSRKFIWDAMGVNINGNEVMAMSFYPKEGNPLWERYSTKLVAHTIKTYSKYTIDYPYPVAISVHSKQIGMEYPMICFNGGRPESDGTYSESTKYGMWGVVIHEVGHNFFPMIINSDERQWTWMDEGLNTFVQYLTEQEWERNYPSKKGPASSITDYMRADKSVQNPIMTNSESIIRFGDNAYGKPAAALNILRETVMGRELFDYAFKTYCERWKFKHPTPADFFRTMEDASAVDLDWFWRGWFYSTENVDIALDKVNYYELNTYNPVIEKEIMRQEDTKTPQNITQIRNKTAIEKTVNEMDDSINDIYSTNVRYEVDAIDKDKYERLKANLTPEDIKLLNDNKQFYELTFKNVGGLISPVIIQFTFNDDTQETIKLPAEIWLTNQEEFTKVFIFDKEVKKIKLDPFLETADTELNNNTWPVEIAPTRYQLYQQKQSNENLMQRQIKLQKK